MQILFLGDTHGDSAIKHLNWYLAQNGIHHVMQCGDLGMRWPGGSDRNFRHFEKLARKNIPAPKWSSCGGNHEPYHREEYKNGLWSIAPRVDIVERGTCQQVAGLNILFIGGAESSDSKHRCRWGKQYKQAKAARISARPWWPEESLTMEQLERAEAIVETTKIDMVVSHEAPTPVRPWRNQGVNKDGIPTDRTSKRLERLRQVMLYNNNIPTHWWYGHHHLQKTDCLEGTEFRCAGILDTFNPRTCDAGWIYDTESKRIYSFSWPAKT